MTSLELLLSGLVAGSVIGGLGYALEAIRSILERK